MQFLGIGVHLLIALFFAVHAVRTGRELFWLFILFSFPLLGSLVYFIVVFLPTSGVDHGLRKAASAAARGLDPGRELREARDACALTPTAQNHMRLANALLTAGQAAEAAREFEQCRRGPFASDPEIGFWAARAHVAAGQAQTALPLLEAIAREHPGFRAESVCLALAGARARLGQQQEAGEGFRLAVQRFGTVEARAELAIWAAGVGDFATAQAERGEMDRSAKHWPRRTRALHEGTFARVDAALQAARRRS